MCRVYVAMCSRDYLWVRSMNNLWCRQRHTQIVATLDAQIGIHGAHLNLFKYQHLNFYSNWSMGHWNNYRPIHSNLSQKAKYSVITDLWDIGID